MACSTKAGPQVYLATIENISGVSFSQEQYHALKRLAENESRVKAFQRLTAEALESGESTNPDVIGPRVDVIVKEETSRARATVTEKVSAASALGAKLAEDSGDPDGYWDDRVRMMELAKEANVTKGTIAVMDAITTFGAKRAARMADTLIEGWRQNESFKKRLEANAKAERVQNPKLAEGLEKAASMMTKYDTMPVQRWKRSGEMEAEYPGLSEVYDLLNRGPESARKFSMFSYEGNVAADAAASKVEADMRAAAARGETWSNEEAAERYYGALDALAKKFPEVHDTEPRAEFITRMGDTARDLGWLDVSDLYEF